MPEERARYSKGGSGIASKEQSLDEPGGGPWLCYFLFQEPW